MEQRSVVEADRLLVLLFLWRRRVVIETTTPHTCICLPLTRNLSTRTILHHRAFDLRNPAPPPFSPAEPPKTFVAVALTLARIAKL